MDRDSVFVGIKEERKNLSFFKIFQCADLSSECMRTFPFDFMKSVPNEDLSDKMVIRTQWGSSWEVDISKNPRVYYMEKSGWNQFVSDNALGENEFITFTHKGLMCFDVNIYGKNGKEIVRPRNLPTMPPSSGIKKDQGESSYKYVKKEEVTGESMQGVELEATKKKAEESKTSKKKKKKIKSKKVVNSVEIGESSREVLLNVREKNAKKSKTSEMKKIKRDRVRVKNGVPEFEFTIRKAGLILVTIPKLFEKHIPNESKMFTIHHSKGSNSWEVMSCVRKTSITFSRGWIKLAREHPLEFGDRCTLQLIKPNEFLLVVSKKAREKITIID